MVEANRRATDALHGAPPRPTLATLPVDARDRIALIDALTTGRRDPENGAPLVREDGELVSVDVALSEDDDALHAALLKHFGDVRCLDRAGRPLLQVRFYRDGRRDAGDLVIGPHEVWPQTDGTLAVDLDRAPCTADRWVALLELGESARGRGRLVYFVNVPPHFRLHAEAGSGAELLARDVVGPQLPDVLRRRG